MLLLRFLLYNHQASHVAARLGRSGESDFNILLYVHRRGCIDEIQGSRFKPRAQRLRHLQDQQTMASTSTINIITNTNIRSPRPLRRPRITCPPHPWAALPGREKKSNPHRRNKTHQPTTNRALTDLRKKKNKNPWPCSDSLLCGWNVAFGPFASSCGCLLCFLWGVIG